MEQIDTHQIIVKIPKEEIVFVDMVFKSYEGLAMLTHKEKGTIILDVTDETHGDVIDILDDMRNKFPVKIIKE